MMELDREEKCFWNNICLGAEPASVLEKNHCTNECLALPLVLFLLSWTSDSHLKRCIWIAPPEPRSLGKGSGRGRDEADRVPAFKKLFIFLTLSPLTPTISKGFLLHREEPNIHKFKTMQYKMLIKISVLVPYWNDASLPAPNSHSLKIPPNFKTPWVCGLYTAFSPLLIGSTGWCIRISHEFGVWGKLNYMKYLQRYCLNRVHLSCTASPAAALSHGGKTERPKQDQKDMKRFTAV